MRRIHIDAVQGNEILAKTIYSSLDTILMSEGVRLRKVYIQVKKFKYRIYLYRGRNK